MEDRVIQQAEQILADEGCSLLLKTEIKSLALDFAPPEIKGEILHVQGYHWHSETFMKESGRALRVALASMRQGVGTPAAAMIPVWVAQVKDAVLAALPVVDDVAPDGGEVFPIASVLSFRNGQYHDQRSNGSARWWVLTSLQQHSGSSGLPPKVALLADTLSTLGVRASWLIGTPPPAPVRGGRTDPVLVARFFGAVHVAVAEWA